MNHGTYAGAVQHYQRGEKPCDSCREARNAYRRDYYRTSPKLRAYQREWRRNHPRANRVAAAEYNEALATLRECHREEFAAILAARRRERMEA